MALWPSAPALRRPAPLQNQPAPIQHPRVPLQSQWAAALQLRRSEGWQEVRMLRRQALAPQ
jgi:hypothetical protein